MNLSNTDELKNFLKQQGLRPKDYLGQNFLVDEMVLEEILEAAELKPNDTVIEVGPGLGVLTQKLIERAGKVIAVEKDEKLFEILNRNAELDSASKKDPESSSGWRNAILINQDILRFHLEKHAAGDYKVVANIPYYLTSKLFQYFLQQSNKPSLLVLMVQKEVGERVVARAGELSLLGISVQVFADPSIVAKVPKTSFWPVPKVDSVILKIVPRNKYPQIKNQENFFRILKIAFAGKRKQIKNSLRAYSLELEKSGIDPMARPQDLTIEQWIKLYQVIGDRL